MISGSGVASKKCKFEENEGDCDESGMVDTF